VAEQYELVKQLRRSASSIPVNIAEGHGRGTRKDHLHFLAVANGSLMETETTLMLAIRLKYLSNGEVRSAMSLMTEIGKMLSVLRARLKG
jgi:four helix bundle protein